MNDEKPRGQADKKAAEERTQQVAAENERQDVQERIGPDQTPERSDSAPGRRAVDAALDPYPEYEQKEVGELESLASTRGVEINRDVEKAELIHKLRENDGKAAARGKELVEGASNPYASYDVIPLEELRKLAESRGVELDEEFKTAHLITELRAADTSGGVSIKVNPVSK
jgi:hypothetical protein